MKNKNNSIKIFDTNTKTNQNSRFEGRESVVPPSLPEEEAQRDRLTVQAVLPQPVDSESSPAAGSVTVIDQQNPTSVLYSYTTNQGSSIKTRSKTKNQQNGNHDGSGFLNPRQSPALTPFEDVPLLVDAPSTAVGAGNLPSQASSITQHCITAVLNLIVTEYPFGF